MFSNMWHGKPAIWMIIRRFEDHPTPDELENQFHTVYSDFTTGGSHPICDIFWMKKEEVSPHHFNLVLSYDMLKMFIVDVSPNPNYIQIKGVRIPKNEYYEIKHKDRILLGNYMTIDTNPLMFVVHRYRLD